MEETQRDLEASLIRRAQQNDDIIAYNSHMAKVCLSFHTWHEIFCVTF